MCYCPHFIDEAQRGEAVLPNVTQPLNKKAESYDSKLKIIQCIFKSAISETR